MTRLEEMIALNEQRVKACRDRGDHVMASHYADRILWLRGVIPWASIPWTEEAKATLTSPEIPV